MEAEAGSTKKGTIYYFNSIYGYVYGIMDDGIRTIPQAAIPINNDTTITLLGTGETKAEINKLQHTLQHLNISILFRYYQTKNQP